MVGVDCPRPGCAHKTADVDSAVAAVLLSDHLRTVHPEPVHAKLKPIDSPVIGHNTTQETWRYFLSSRASYKIGTGSGLGPLINRPLPSTLRLPLMTCDSLGSLSPPLLAVSMPKFSPRHDAGFHAYEGGQ